MARASEPAVTPDDIVFELERFERSDDRLNLAGRWFGVRGRRFVRPTLTLGVDGGRIRSLADLDDKPWAAEDGQPWMASFPWESDGEVEQTELSVAPDIAIQLPAPSSRRGRAQRLSAVPRREAMTASWGEWATAAGDCAPSATEEEPPEAGEVATPAPEPDESPSVAPEPEPQPPTAPTREQVQTLMLQLAEATGAAAATSAELEALRSELAAAKAQLEEARRELGRQGSACQAFEAELTATRAAREAALRSAARAEAERESALTRAAQAEAERESLAADSAGVAAELERARSELDRLARERDQAVATRGAALVMRGATHALPAHERHVGWLRRGLALLLLFGAVFAALIVLHVL